LKAEKLPDNLGISEASGLSSVSVKAALDDLE
jgi:hypothetical protein